MGPTLPQQNEIHGKVEPQIFGTLELPAGNSRRRCRDNASRATAVLGAGGIPGLVVGDEALIPGYLK